MYKTYPRGYYILIKKSVYYFMQEQLLQKNNLTRGFFFISLLWVASWLTINWRGGWNFPESTRQEAIQESLDSGLIQKDDNVEVHHMIPASVGRDQGIDKEVITSIDNALAIPDWVHKQLHREHTLEELASMGYEGTLEAIEEIINQE